MTTTYQDRVRHLRLNTSVTFPTGVLLKATFAPNAALGGPLKHGSILGVVGKEGVRLSADQYTGWIEPTDVAPLEGMELLIPSDVGGGAYRDSVLTWGRDVSSSAELRQVVSFVCYALPQVLSVNFVDPPVLSSVSVEIDGVDYPVTVDKMTTSVESTTFDAQQERFTEAWHWAEVILLPKHRRMQRALDYFTQAVRLQRLGASPWEFLAEVLLNYCKSLPRSAIVSIPPSWPDTCTEVVTPRGRSPNATASSAGVPPACRRNWHESVASPSPIAADIGISESCVHNWLARS